MKIGVSFIVSNMTEYPVFRTALEWSIRSLQQSDLMAYDWKLAILDNASSCEDTISYVLDLPDDRFIKMRNEKRASMSQGRNQTIRALLDWGPDYILEIDSDQLFPSSWLTTLIEAMEADPSIGIIGPVYLNAFGVCGSPHFPDSYHKDYDTVQNQIEIKCKETVDLYKTRTQLVPGVPRPDLKRMACVNEIGIYHDDMPGDQTVEDVEEAYRAWKAGWKTYYHRGSWTYHRLGLSRYAILAADPQPDDENPDRRAIRLNNEFSAKIHGAAEWSEFQPIYREWTDNIYLRP